MTGTDRKAKLIVSGIMFWYPLAGVTFQFLHYLIGLRRLGYDVHYIEDCEGWVYDPRVNEFIEDASANVDTVSRVLEANGFADRWAFRGRFPGGQSFGLPEERVDRLYREADAFLNVTGAQFPRDEQLGIPRRIYVESDPFVSQVRADAGDPEKVALLAGHDTHFTFGESIGTDACDLPTLGLDWKPTRQPVVMDLWDHDTNGHGGAYTTISTWINKGKELQYRGETYYWTKDREFKKFIDLPRRRPLTFELAAGLDEDGAVLLRENGWRNITSIEVSSDIEAYRSYIQRSRAEFTVAKDQVVRPRTGWFSDRSASYLGAGRPVITQETGFSRHLPTGEGLFAFETMDDILAAVDAIESDYPRHCRAAREIASEYFGAEKVLGSLMERAGL